MDNTPVQMPADVSEHVITIPSPLIKKKKQPMPKKHLKDRWKKFLSQDKEGNLLVEGLSVKDQIGRAHV